jgi:hypothetical protein
MTIIALQFCQHHCAQGHMRSLEKLEVHVRLDLQVSNLLDTKETEALSLRHTKR